MVLYNFGERLCEKCLKKQQQQQLKIFDSTFSFICALFPLKFVFIHWRINLGDLGELASFLILKEQI